MTNDIAMFNRWAELAALFEEGQGMVAENQFRLRDNYAIAYEDISFNDLASRMRALKGPEAAQSDVSDGQTPPVKGESEDYETWAIRQFSGQMSAKMKQKKAEGKHGWDDPSVISSESLAKALLEHVYKGDPVDVANYCMMLWFRSSVDAMRELRTPSVTPHDVSGGPPPPNKEELDGIWHSAEDWGIIKRELEKLESLKAENAKLREAAKYANDHILPRLGPNEQREWHEEYKEVMGDGE